MWKPALVGLLGLFAVAPPSAAPPAAAAEPSGAERLRGFSAEGSGVEREVEARLAALADPQRIRERHRYFTALPHPAGSARNRELAFEALVGAIMGLLVTAFIFGAIAGLAWLATFFIGTPLGLDRSAFALGVAALFLLVAVVSAWRRVDPLAGLTPMTDRQLMLTLISLGSPHLLYFSPRHATAGAAAVILGGPASLCEALGTWAHRLRWNRAMVREAARLLERSRDACPADAIGDARAGLLLKRLALVKTIERGGAPALTATERGREVLEGRDPDGNRREER